MEDFTLIETGPSGENSGPPRSKGKRLAMFPPHPSRTMLPKRRYRKLRESSNANRKTRHPTNRDRDGWEDVSTVRGSFFEIIFFIFDKIFTPFVACLRFILTFLLPILPILLAACTICLFIHVAYQIVMHPFQALQSITSVGNWVAALNTSSIATSFSAIRCSLYLGACSPIPALSQITKLAAEHSHQTGDLFHSFVALSDPQNMGLHSIDMWENGAAIKGTSNFEGHEPLGEGIMEFGNGLREVKDTLIAINSKGVNSFSWIIQEYRRIELVIDHIHQKSLDPAPSFFNRALSSISLFHSPAHMDPLPSLTRNMELMFATVDRSLSELVDDIDIALPVILSVSELGKELGQEMATVKGYLRDAYARGDKWWKIKTQELMRLQREFELVKDALHDVVIALRHLETVRMLLLAHSKNTDSFKRGLVAFHLADHGLPTQAERELLRHSMVKFQNALDKVHDPQRFRSELGQNPALGQSGLGEGTSKALSVGG
ncbi:hypothetical protein BT69DRAFT_1352914 [Atractiella rhizophila]|nr:hypothetical protein BT69DRAFT_1352914 [Atractiella rhizophila]